jgi:hypothetical protein
MICGQSCSSEDSGVVSGPVTREECRRNVGLRCLFAPEKLVGVLYLSEKEGIDWAPHQPDKL